MFREIASSLGGISGLVIGQITNPALTGRVLALLGDRVRTFTPLFYNTVSPTILQASNKFNVIPSEITVKLDGRLLPGFKPNDMMNELCGIIDRDVELEILRYDPGPAEPDMGLFDQLVDILRQADPAGVPVPLLLSGITDGRYFSRLGIQTYGFLPMYLPEDFNFSLTIHAANERIPIEALEFGTRAMYQALQRHEP
jgi:acetylornithine deacetylase/succinyl-diaminopimelate desuccinylase-like protein